MGEEGRGLRFQGLSSVADVSFWETLGRFKLEEFKLEVEDVPIDGWYAPSRSAHVGGRVRVNGDSFARGKVERRTENASLGTNECVARGVIRNVNTVEEFKNLDKKMVLKQLGNALLEEIKTGKVERDPSLLVPFLIISFADLKKHKYLYWFGFPALVDKHADYVVEENRSLEEHFKTKDLHIREALSTVNQGFFIFVFDRETKTLGGVHKLSEWSNLSAEQREKAYFGFIDPCPLKEYPGWPLRNLLVYVKEHCKVEREVKVICLRQTEEESRVFRVRGTFRADPEYSIVGWEPNVQGKMGPRLVDLSAQLDPIALAGAACNLNLKLMRWRALPSLDTEMLSKTKCLLVGSGTLGCAVARDLLGWGFRHVTMLDNGRVSYSNPVRQSLFTFEDCQNGGIPKAQAAAAALERIFPLVSAQGVDLSIPMPGHFVSVKEVDQVGEDVSRLENLVETHDVIFLLTDTRESRWLPTLLGNKHDKIVLNAALGFDSFLVMRHGFGLGGANATNSELARPGCYFCNDVVAPQNSTRDRTLDQQCTVTRPGLAPMAGAIAVELLVTLLHHPLKNRAPVTEQEDDRSQAESAPSSKLGTTPHQVRGFLPSFALVSIQGPAFAQCTACSQVVLDTYNAKGMEMLLEAFNTPEYLEKLTGLDELKRQAEVQASEIELDWDNEEDLESDM